MCVIASFYALREALWFFWFIFSLNYSLPPIPAYQTALHFRTSATNQGGWWLSNACSSMIPANCIFLNIIKQHRGSITHLEESVSFPPPLVWARRSPWFASVREEMHILCSYNKQKRKPNFMTKIKVFSCTLFGFISKYKKLYGSIFV